MSDVQEWTVHMQNGYMTLSSTSETTYDICECTLDRTLQETDVLLRELPTDVDIIVNGIRYTLRPEGHVIDDHSVTRKQVLDYLVPWDYDKYVRRRITWFRRDGIAFKWNPYEEFWNPYKWYL